MGARDLHITARPAASMNELIEESLNGLSRWVESRQCRAYNPGDVSDVIPAATDLRF